MSTYRRNAWFGTLRRWFCSMANYKAAKLQLSGSSLLLQSCEHVERGRSDAGQSIGNTFGKVLDGMWS